MASGLDQVVRMPASKIEAAQNYAQTKTWLDTARRTAMVYRAALEKR